MDNQCFAMLNAQPPIIPNPNQYGSGGGPKILICPWKYGDGGGATGEWGKSGLPYRQSITYSTWMHNPTRGQVGRYLRWRWNQFWKWTHQYTMRIIYGGGLEFW